MAGFYRFRHLVFDWDGTIHDSIPTIAQCLREAIERAGVRPPPSDRLRYVIGMGGGAAFRYLFDGASLSELTKKRISLYYRKIYRQREAEIPLFFGMAEFLQKLKQKGFALSIITGKSAEGIQRALDLTGLQSLFIAVSFADAILHKPMQEYLKSHLYLLGASPLEAVLIGDTTFDLEMAQALGMGSIAVAYGGHSEAMLRPYRPLFLARTPLELYSLFETQGSVRPLD